MDAFTGMIAAFGFAFAPQDWGLCTGQLVSVEQYTVLYSLIGTFFGGDGRVSFGYPDLRSRMAAGSSTMGVAPALDSFPLGSMYGVQSVRLTVLELPAHYHTATFTGTDQNGPTLTFAASTSAADLRAPNIGDYLASQPTSGTFSDMYVDHTSPGTLVPLGGLEWSVGEHTGTVSLHETGASEPVSVLNPFLAVNFCICEAGTYPSRN